jgi:hypothetical protein
MAFKIFLSKTFKIFSSHFDKTQVSAPYDSKIPADSRC